MQCVGVGVEFFKVILQEPENLSEYGLETLKYFLQYFIK